MNIVFLLPSRLSVGPNIFTATLIRAVQDKLPSANIRAYSAKPDGDLGFSCDVGHLQTFTPSLQQEAEFVFSTMLRTDLWLAGRSSSIPASRRASIVHNLFEEDLEFLYRPPFPAALKLLWRHAFKKIGTVIVSSPGMSDYYKERVSTSLRTITIPYGIVDPLKTANPRRVLQPHPQNRYFDLVSCGSLIKRKNFSIVLSALVHLTDCRFNLIGDGPEMTSLKDQARRLGVADRVRFLGYRENIREVLSNFHAYVMPSFSEGFGLALLEAMALGLPIACSDLRIYEGELDKAIVPRFSPHSTESLVAAVRTLRANHLHFSQGTRELYVQKYKSELMATRYVQLICGRVD